MKTKIYNEFIKAFEKNKIGGITICTPDNLVYNFQGEQPGIDCDFIIKDWLVIDAIIKRGDIGLGETYCQNLWESSNVAKFLSYCSLNLDYIKNSGSATLLNRILFYFFNNFTRLNTKHGSKKNIIEHYDIGNSFYKMWLDPTMTYSSALRCSSNDTLETAQLNKYGRIIDTLSLEGKNVLEIGCGWGGFAEQAANAGANVTGITISNEQFHFAKNRIGSKANILMQDYRDIKKKYDHIVSIEMFEAVGERYWSTYFSKIKESLTKGGRAIIQTITIRDDVFNAYRKNSDYIRHYVFPGGMLPSKNRFYNEVNNAKMDVASVLEFGQDYAWTLKQWLNAFVDVRNKLTNLNYSPYFLRAWEFYLSMCIAGFETKRTDVVQFEIVK
jgi:cyclopropane-fatty-acyl-phospholipid synthase